MYYVQNFGVFWLFLLCWHNIWSFLFNVVCEFEEKLNSFMNWVCYSIHVDKDMLINFDCQTVSLMISLPACSNSYWVIHVKIVYYDHRSFIDLCVFLFGSANFYFIYISRLCYYFLCLSDCLTQLLLQYNHFYLVILLHLKPTSLCSYSYPIFYWQVFNISLLIFLLLIFLHPYF